MSLNKAIKYGKEKRKPYRGAKSVSSHCRNHGGKKGKSRNPWECEWCKGNRLYSSNRREISINYEQKDFEQQS